MMPLSAARLAPRRAHSHQTPEQAQGQVDLIVERTGTGGTGLSAGESPRRGGDDVVLPNSRAAYPGWSRFAKSRGPALFVLSLITSAASAKLSCQVGEPVPRSSPLLPSPPDSALYRPLPSAVLLQLGSSYTASELVPPKPQGTAKV